VESHSVRKICDNTDSITESTKSGTKVFVKLYYYCPIRMNHTTNYGRESLVFLLHYK